MHRHCAATQLSCTVWSSLKKSDQASFKILPWKEPLPRQTEHLMRLSEAWGPPQFHEKRSRSEKAILGALGEFPGILGAALGVQKLILRMRNSILGMASHDLSNTKTTILGGTPRAILEIDGHPHERFSFAPAFSKCFVQSWGGSRAQEINPQQMSILYLFYRQSVEVL